MQPTPLYLANEDEDIIRLYDDENYDDGNSSVSGVHARSYDDRGRETAAFPAHNQEEDALAPPSQQRQLIVPSDLALHDFRNQVNTWIEVDNTIRRLQMMLKDRRDFKHRLSEKIVQFMKHHDLSNLDMGEAGVIRSRRAKVKSPLSQRSIKDGILSYFEQHQNVTLGVQLTDCIFNNRVRTERVSLSRCMRNDR